MCIRTTYATAFYCVEMRLFDGCTVVRGELQKSVKRYNTSIARAHIRNESQAPQTHQK